MRSWTHLERQRGGFGFLGGPGETQLEADRRQIQKRIKKIEGELAACTNMRAVHRAERQARAAPDRRAGRLHERRQVDAVQPADRRRHPRQGHALCHARSDAPPRASCRTARRSILSDTVGFISDLPTMLVAAFRATLEEVLEADLILHVRDIASPERSSRPRT